MNPPILTPAIQERPDVPPDIWVPVHQEPMLAGDSTLLDQSIAAWLRVIGRLHPGASTAGMAPQERPTQSRSEKGISGY